LDEAAELSNEYAPEHLCLLVDEPSSLARKLRNAGGVFLGSSSPEVIGDYAAGPSHVMPVGGTAAFASPLNVGDFVKITSIFDIPDGDSKNLAEISARLARAEGLEGHARAADLRVGISSESAQDVA
jgi:histidinol dehydrogenase